MALCLRESSGRLLVDGAYDAIQCVDGYALLSSVEYNDVPTLAALFSMPDALSVQEAFMAGFSLPLICYLTAWGYGLVINWFNSRSLSNLDEYE